MFENREIESTRKTHTRKQEQRGKGERDREGGEGTKIERWRKRREGMHGNTKEEEIHKLRRQEEEKEGVRRKRDGE